jgi:hypothetical protein
LNLNTERVCKFEWDYEAERKRAAATKQLKTDGEDNGFLSSSLKEGLTRELGGAATLIASENKLTLNSLTTSLIQPVIGHIGEMIQPDIGDIGEMVLSKLLSVGLRVALDDLGRQSACDDLQSKLLPIRSKKTVFEQGEPFLSCLLDPGEDGMPVEQRGGHPSDSPSDDIQPGTVMAEAKACPKTMGKGSIPGDISWVGPSYTTN